MDNFHGQSCRRHTEVGSSTLGGVSWLKEWLLKEDTASTERSGIYTEVEMVDFDNLTSSIDGKSISVILRTIDPAAPKMTRRNVFIGIYSLAMIAAAFYFTSKNSSVLNEESDNSERDETVLSSGSSTNDAATTSSFVDICPTKYIHWMKYKSVQTFCEYYDDLLQRFDICEFEPHFCWMEEDLPDDMISIESDDVRKFHDLRDNGEWKLWNDKQSPYHYKGKVVGANYCDPLKTIESLNLEQLGAFRQEFATHHGEHIRAKDLAGMYNNGRGEESRGIVFDECTRKEIYWLEATTLESICMIEDQARQWGYEGAVNLCTGVFAPQRLTGAAFEELCPGSDSKSGPDGGGAPAQNRLQNPVEVMSCNDQHLTSLRHEEWYSLCDQWQNNADTTGASEDAASSTQKEKAAFGEDYETLLAESCPEKWYHWLSRDAWDDVCQIEVQVEKWGAVERSGSICTRDVFACSQ